MNIRWEDRGGPVRKRIMRKGKHHKGPDIPFIVAINCMDFRSIDGSREVMSEALFGRNRF